MGVVTVVLAEGTAYGTAPGVADSAGGRTPSAHNTATVSAAPATTAPRRRAQVRSRLGRRGQGSPGGSEYEGGAASWLTGSSGIDGSLLGNNRSPSARMQVCSTRGCLVRQRHSRLIDTWLIDTRRLGDTFRLGEA